MTTQTLKEIDTYLDILSGERDFPEIGNECLETCPPNCDEHKWHCVYWIRLAPEVAYSDTYYDYADGVNNADVYTDGYVGVSRRLECRYREHRYEDTKDNHALLKELFEWYGDGIQLLILEEGLSRTKAYEVEGFYRPYPNIGWNKATGGKRVSPTVEGRKKTTETNRKRKPKYVCQPSTGKQAKIPLAELEDFFEENPTWRIGKMCTAPVGIYTYKLCFSKPKKSHWTSEQLETYLTTQQETVCENPSACCLSYIPIQDLAEGVTQLYLNLRLKQSGIKTLEESKRRRIAHGLTQTPPDNTLMYTLQKGKQRKELSKTEWLDFFQCSENTFYLYVNAKYTIEINGKVYKAYKKKLDSRYKDAIKLRPVIDINHSIHDWELIKKERKRDYDKRNNN